MAENTGETNAFTEATGVDVIIPRITPVTDADSVTLSPELRAELAARFAEVKIPTIRIEMLNTDAEKLYNQDEIDPISKQ